MKELSSKNLANVKPAMNTTSFMALKDKNSYSPVEPLLVYFSSVTENTKHFVDKLEYSTERIPLRRTDPFLNIASPYILVVPSYGGGAENSAVPKQVIKFLNEKTNRDLCLGVIAAGNMNFGAHYCIAGRIIQKKLNVPIFYNFELRGMPGDLERVKEGVQEVFERFNSGLISTANGENIKQFRDTPKLEEDLLINDRV